MRSYIFIAILLIVAFNQGMTKIDDQAEHLAREEIDTSVPTPSAPQPLHFGKSR